MGQQTMTPEEIVNAVTQLSKDMTRPSYRGHAKATWQLQSGAYRRLREAHGEDFPSDESERLQMLDRYHRDRLITPMEVIDGSKLSQLQRLSILQHQGAATGLLDFTEYPLVALWFSCSESPDEDGKLLAIDIGDPQHARNVRSSEQMMECPFNAEHRSAHQILYYEPDQSLGTRIIAQRSMFVIGDSTISDHLFKSATVPRQSKEQLLVYLEELGLSETTLFGDIPGLAAANTTRTKLRITGPLLPAQHRDRGNRAYQAGRFANALAEYESYAKALPSVAQPYCLQGDTLAALGRFEEAKQAYSLAIQNLDRPIYHAEQVIANPDIAKIMAQKLYYNMGNVRAVTGDHKGALADFDMALQQGFQPRQWVLYNRGNSKFALQRFSEAYEDFEAAWLLQERSASALAMGNCKVKHGEFREALQQYLNGSTSQTDNAATHCRNNGEQVRKILNALDGRDYQVRNEGVVVYVETSEVAGYYSFTGHSGNTGNSASGMVTTQGGEGYDGVEGFVVVITSPNTPSLLDRKN